MRPKTVTLFAHARKRAPCQARLRACTTTIRCGKCSTITASLASARRAALHSSGAKAFVIGSSRYGLCRNRIEQSEQHKPADETADMGLPGDGLVVAGDRDRTHPEQKIQSEPHRDECEDARIAQRIAKRQGRHLVAFLRCRRSAAVRRAGTQSASPPPSRLKCVAEAPTIGTIWPKWVTRCASAPVAAVAAQNARKRTAPNRRASGVPKATSQIELKPRCIQSPWISA